MGGITGHFADDKDHYYGGGLIYWPSINCDVERVASYCRVCQVVKNKNIIQVYIHSYPYLCHIESISIWTSF